MTAGSQPVHLLPPRPRPRDWITAGACAGVLLGVAESLVAAARGPALPPPLQLAIVASGAVLVAVASGAVGLTLRLRATRASRSALVGAVVGPLAFAPLVSSLYARLPGALELAGLAAGALLCVVAGLAAARLADRVERSGTPASAPLVWGGAALLLAGSERLSLGESRLSAGGLAGLVAAVAAVALGVAGALALGRRRASRPSMPFGKLLALLGLVTVSGSFAPWALPWLLYDAELPSRGVGPPNVLFVALGADRQAGPGSASALAEHLAWVGVAYERFLPEPVSGARALLTLPDGRALVPQLRAGGYATAAILTEASAFPDVGSGEVDARPGDRRLLEGSASWMAGAALLVGPGSGALSRLGLDALARTPEQLSADAQRWLLRWRATRAPAPFFLLVDFGTPPRPGGLEAAEAGFLSLLEQIEKLEVAEVTMVVLALEGTASARASGEASHLLVVLRPPPSWRLAGQSPRAAGWIRPSDLAETLLRISRSDADTPIALPGLPGPRISGQS